jgi:hypothetical protein
MPAHEKTPKVASGKKTADLDTIRGEVEEGRQEDRMTILKIEKEDMLNRDIKSYENNIQIIGMKFDIKEAQKRDDDGRTAWRKQILDFLVTSKIVSASKVFHQSGANKGKELRGILRDAHPLRQQDNAAIVVAFTENWFANQIKNRIKGKGLNLEAGVKVHPHYPPIIDALKNEAMRERRRLLEIDGSNSTRKIICATPMKKPWVQLIEVVEGRRVSLPFPVEDGRLVDPAATLARLALEGKEYKLLKYVIASERASIPKNLIIEATPMRADGPNQKDEGMELKN